MADAGKHRSTASEIPAVQGRAKEVRGMPVVRVWAVVCRKQCYGKRVTNTASEVKWIKIVTDIFDDEKILLIEAMPEADGIIVIWFKILCLAGKINNCGLLTMSDRIAYTDEMLAHIFRRPLNTVRLALKTFEQFGMIEIINDTIVIPNWEKHQNVEKMVEIREYNRLAKQRSRERQRLNGLMGDSRDDCVNDMSMTCQPSSISVSNISSCSSHKEEKNKAGGEKGKVNENSEALRKKPLSGSILKVRQPKRLHTLSRTVSPSMISASQQ